MRSETKLILWQLLGLLNAVMHIVAWVIAFVGFVHGIYNGEQWYFAYFALFYMIRIGFTGDRCPFVLFEEKIYRKLQELKDGSSSGSGRSTG